MIFFPLALVVGAVTARRLPLPWAMAAGSAVFALAILVAWQVQGFPPSPRDLVWLAVVLAVTWASSRLGKRRRERTEAAA